MHNISNDRVDTDLGRILRIMEPFVAQNGKLAGCPVRSTEHWGHDLMGRLPGDLVEQIKREDHPTYVVWSYGTPIAWIPEHGNERAPGDWIIPAEFYSTTTSRHQGAVRRALGVERSEQLR